MAPWAFSFGTRFLSFGSTHEMHSHIAQKWAGEYSENCNTPEILFDSEAAVGMLNPLHYVIPQLHTAVVELVSSSGIFTADNTIFSATPT